MPVRKYHSVEEIEDAFWNTPGTSAHRRAVRFAIESAALFTSPKNLPAGVFKFHSLEEADSQREAWERGKNAAK